MTPAEQAARRKANELWDFLVVDGLVKREAGIKEITADLLSARDEGIEAAACPRRGPEAGVARRLGGSSQPHWRRAAADSHLCGGDACILVPDLGAGALSERRVWDHREDDRICFPLCRGLFRSHALRAHWAHRGPHRRTLVYPCRRRNSCARPAGISACAEPLVACDNHSSRAYWNIAPISRNDRDDVEAF